MENTLKSFKKKQSQSLQLLERLYCFLQQGMEAGVPIDPALIIKLENNISNVEGQKLKVALIGGFSEGKTSIAAAWMEKLDKSSMKISHQESSNEVKVYEVGEEFVLVDTPGLFGFKEQKNAETLSIEKYKDLTKKHVSEAHLVLYVMNSTNPIKESHKEDLEWLFRTLNLLSRTVFVLSRFDEVADIEDEEDYQNNLDIKRANVTGRLRDMIGLTKDEVDTLSIVAVAANPFDEGVNYWLQNIEQFKALSHISTLQAATTEKIQQNGGGDALDIDMRTSVISDVLHKQLPIAIETDTVVSEEVYKLEQLYGRLNTQLLNTNQQIEETRLNLRNFVMSYFTDLILQSKGCSLETFGDFFEREIGSEGVIINTHLQNEFSRQMGAITLEVEKMQISFNNEVSHFNITIKALGQNGINHALKGNLINNKTILATRDGVISVAKALGMDIGKYLKFKPWGAINLAKGANAALAFLGVALEVWESYSKYKREEEFRESVKVIVSNLEKQRDELLSIINSEEFKGKFFFGYIELSKQLTELDVNLKDSRDRQAIFSAWRKEAEVIEGELMGLGK